MDVVPRSRIEALASMGPLAKLPVFWALEGKRVVVASGSDAAAWKSELLAACGAVSLSAVSLAVYLQFGFAKAF
jgi:uroporphyrin-III C-methyltransferase/precorrin-2 dehydrogenase/sirohydrochlorin ferrochelatase